MKASLRFAFLLLVTSVTAGCGGGEDPCQDQDNALAPGIVCTVAGSGDRDFNGDGLDARETAFHSLSSVSLGPGGALYVADANNQRIRTVDSEGLIQTVAGSGVHGHAHVGGLALESPLHYPGDFAFDGEGRLVIVTQHDPRILRVEHDGTLANLAGNGDHGDVGDGGPALAAAFLEPAGIAIAADGTIFIADALAGRVRAIAGGTIEAVAGNGEFGYSGDGGPAALASLEYPTALAIDVEGRLLIADSVNHAIRRVNQDGNIVTIAGTGAKGFSGDGGPATAAALNSPEGIAVDEAGTIYFSDTRNHRIRSIDAEGIVRTIAGSGESGWQGDGGDALNAKFYTPMRLALRGRILYVADFNNERVRAVGLP